MDKYLDAVLVVLGHGTTKDEDSAAPVLQHAAELRRRGIFAEVREAFWKQEPFLKEVLHGLTAKRVFIAPLFVSEGYFSEQVIPQAIGLEAESGKAGGRVLNRSNQIIYYTKVIGTHPSMTKILCSRAREVMARFPFPRAPKLQETTLFVAGHGTEQNKNSRVVIEHHAQSIRELSEFAAVETVFLDEEPRIGTVYQTALTKNIVVVPFFISDGLHVRQDIPVLLGEPERIVRQRLEKGQAPWRNPTERKEKLLWYAPAVGSDRAISEVVLERVAEAATWA